MSGLGRTQRQFASGMDARASEIMLRKASGPTRGKVAGVLVVLTEQDASAGCVTLKERRVLPVRLQ